MKDLIISARGGTITKLHPGRAIMHQDLKKNHSVFDSWSVSRVTFVTHVNEQKSHIIIMEHKNEPQGEMAMLLGNESKLEKQSTYF